MKTHKDKLYLTTKDLDLIKDTYFSIPKNDVNMLLKTMNSIILTGIYKNDNTNNEHRIQFNKIIYRSISKESRNYTKFSIPQVIYFIFFQFVSISRWYINKVVSDLNTEYILNINVPVFVTVKEDKDFNGVGHLTKYITSNIVTTLSDSYPITPFYLKDYNKYGEKIFKNTFKNVSHAFKFKLVSVFNKETNTLVISVSLFKCFFIPPYTYSF